MLYRIPTVILWITVAFWIQKVYGDPYYFEVYIRCHENVKSCCGDLMIYEEDDRNHDIIKTEQFCTNQNSMNFIYDPVYPGGDFGFEYEFKYRLNHTCTDSGQQRCIQLDEAVDANKGYPKNIHWYISTYNRGRLECYPDGW